MNAKNSDKPEAVPATVLYRAASKGGAIVQVEIDGTVFHPQRDQVEARRQLREQEVGHRIEALGGAEVGTLLGEFEQIWRQRLMEVVDYRMREVANRLISAGHADLWRLVFVDFMEGSAYRPGDEGRFLVVDDPDRGSGY